MDGDCYITITDDDIRAMGGVADSQRTNHMDHMKVEDNKGVRGQLKVAADGFVIY